MWNFDWDLFFEQHKELIQLTLYGLTCLVFWWRGYRTGLKEGKGKMPIATITNNISDQIPLESLPEGYVVVRRMNYGEKLTRSNMATKFLLGGSAKDAASKDFQGEIDLQTREIALWDFANLVVEHNLTDALERKLNFKVRTDVESLDGTIGDEIGRIIDAFNDVESKPETKNS